MQDFNWWNQKPQIYGFRHDQWIPSFFLFFLVNLSMLFIFNVRVCLLLGVLAHEHRLNDVQINYTLKVNNFLRCVSIVLYCKVGKLLRGLVQCQMSSSFSLIINRTQPKQQVHTAKPHSNKTLYTLQKVGFYG